MKKNFLPSPNKNDFFQINEDYIDWFSKLVIIALGILGSALLILVLIILEPISLFTWLC